ncbi:helix-turn-helix domain-containing protein [Sphingomonas hengshuiensis]|uniref:HTH cro/C1-type domain-containing protein n=1 Tax=Sphingomonas hengshuiensis TaxID=1609977 RepID=A0A7U4J8M8_9SPHN|nr:helix-turn-helix transcriptional regulator [Sphingomonas hengshuiensis]AJP72285.1 hypothetical protein TS85_11540 [Sphingomonas hengshuiensis]
MTEGQPNWFLREWIADKKMRQKDLLDRTQWQKSKLSKLVNGGSNYTRETLNALAVALGIEPYELLMRPERARAIREFEYSAYKLAAEGRMPFRPE